MSRSIEFQDAQSLQKKGSDFSWGLHAAGKFLADLI